MAMPKMRFSGSRLSSTTGKPICAMVSAAPNSRPSMSTMAITAAPAMVGTRKLLGAARSAIAAAIKTKPGLSVSIALPLRARRAPAQKQTHNVGDKDHRQRNGAAQQGKRPWLLINPESGSGRGREIEAGPQQQRRHAEEHCQPEPGADPRSSRRPAHACGVHTGDRKVASESASASKLRVAAAQTTMGAARKIEAPSGRL